jgi:molybdopterin molybdotransferase
MDGYAVRGSDVDIAGATLEVIEEVAAGQVAARRVGSGQAIKIMTGAAMPDGADTVVRVEDTTQTGEKVEIAVATPTGTSVRSPGGDVQSGSVVFTGGTRLTAAHIGTLATLGLAHPLVGRRPRVALMSTGDELVAPESEELMPGMIRDSNRPMLNVAVSEAGADVLDMGTVPDDADSLRAALGEAAADADAIVTTGGVSMGEFDVTKAVLIEEAGVEFFPVAMKPGKPQGFGVIGGTPFFGLPGNPVSVFVSFEQFVRPALLAMQGANRLLRPRMQAVAGETFESDPAKEEFIRVTLDESLPPVVRQVGGRGSHVLSGLAGADAFGVVPVGIARIEEGSEMIVEMFKAVESRPIP